MNSRSRTPFVLALVIVVVALAALIAVVATRDDGDGEENASTVPAPATGDAGSGTTAAPGAGSPGGTIAPESAIVTVEGAALPQGQGQDDPATGTPAPALHGTDYSGNQVDIVPGTGGPMLIVFLAHWCPHCNAEIPVLLDWRDSGGIPAELQVFGVSTAVSASRPNYPPGEWLDEKGWEWPVLADDAELSAAAAYGVTGFPYFTIIDADGNVAARGSGEMPIESLDALVDTIV